MKEGVIALEADTAWVVQGAPGDEQRLDELARSLRPDICQRVGKALLLYFGNAVGKFALPYLPRLEVYSGKWGEGAFETMLSDISRQVAALPFAAGTGSSLPYDRSVSTDERVLYHAFVYLRHVLSDSAPREDHLLPALRAVLSEPHRRFERFERVVPLHEARRVGPRTLQRLVTARSDLRRAPAGVAPSLARVLRGHLPESIEETAVRSTLDVPENQFVKAFLDQAIGIVEEIRAIAPAKGEAFAARVVGDCERMLRQLDPVRRASLWDDVSGMRRLPVESTVLHRRRGYRESFRHFVRMRMAPRIPLGHGIDDLLEIRDIAALYELWAFFRVQGAVRSALGPPTVAEPPATTKLQQHLPFDLRIAWEGGTELFYNLRFSRSQAKRRSYSVPLRPDIVLRAADGTIWAFDGKFRLRTVDEVTPEGDEVDDANSPSERRGAFKRADLYKMHAYRDALGIPSVWILYPGHDFRFFEDRHDGVIAKRPSDLPHPVEGVGAIPVRPGESGDELQCAVNTLLQLRRNAGG
jgi:hypothetical protein